MYNTIIKIKKKMAQGLVSEQQKLLELPAPKPRAKILKKAIILVLIILTLTSIILSSHWWQRSSTATQGMRFQVQELERKVQELKKAVEEQKNH